MPKVCLYFQLHQPYRLSDYSVFDISNHSSYFADLNKDNQKIFKKVARKSYYPMLKLLQRLLNWHPDFTFALSCSGVFLDQAEEFEPGVIKLIQELVATGRVEVLAETYYHSLASLYSPAEFQRQVYDHMQKIHQLFKVTPRVFRNTELVYSNKIALLVAKMKFTGMLTEAVPRYLGEQDKTLVYMDMTGQLPLLLKHAELSDDVAFRFSDRNWREYPLSVAKYAKWLQIYPANHIVNLFMDFETFGEHQWADTGIFKFFEFLIRDLMTETDNTFVTPGQVFGEVWSELDEEAEKWEQDLKKQEIKEKVDRRVVKAVPTRFPQLPHYDVPKPISWADVDRDLTAWIDNPLQQDTIGKIYELEEAVLASKQSDLIEDWRRLQTSDHFYYMCTKWSADGDVHAYFSPYDSPYEAYRRFAVVLADLTERVNKTNIK
jgi:alpha-amylase